MQTALVNYGVRTAIEILPTGLEPSQFRRGMAPISFRNTEFRRNADAAVLGRVRSRKETSIFCCVCSKKYWVAFPRRCSSSSARDRARASAFAGEGTRRDDSVQSSGISTALYYVVTIVVSAGVPVIFPVCISVYISAWRYLAPRSRVICAACALGYRPCLFLPFVAEVRPARVYRERRCIDPVIFYNSTLLKFSERITLPVAHVDHSSLDALIVLPSESVASVATGRCD